MNVYWMVYKQTESPFKWIINSFSHILKYRHCCLFLFICLIQKTKLACFFQESPVFEALSKSEAPVVQAEPLAPSNTVSSADLWVYQQHIMKGHLLLQNFLTMTLIVIVKLNIFTKMNNCIIIFLEHSIYIYV